MTIVCYDGETLAADKMSRVLKDCGERKIHSLTKEKITIGFAYAQFEGETILMVGRSGLSKLSNAVVAYLKTRKSFRSLPAHLQKKFPDGVRTGCRLLLITQKSVFRVKITKTFEIKHEHFDRRTKVALGKGYRTAEFLMRVAGSSAVETTQVLQSFFTGCGGGVDYATRLSASIEGKVKHLPPIDNRRASHRAFREHLQIQLLRGCPEGFP